MMKDNNLNIESQANNLTTEQFHKLLAANTAKLNQLRLDYTQRMADLKDGYYEDLGDIIAVEHDAKNELHDAREAYEKAQKDYELTIHGLKKDRSDTERYYNVGKANAKNYWATENEKILCERHNIFERYRDSGGVITGEDKGLLHPSWTRDKKGGNDGEK